MKYFNRKRLNTQIPLIPIEINPSIPNYSDFKINSMTTVMIVNIYSVYLFPVFDFND